MTTEQQEQDELVTEVEEQPATKKRESLFDEVCENELYAKLLAQLPADEKPIVMESLKNFVDDFENCVLEPLKNLDSK